MVCQCLQGVGVVIDAHGRPSAQHPRGNRQHARPGAHVQHRQPSHVDRLQRVEAQPRRGVMTRAETHLGEDHHYLGLRDWGLRDWGLRD